MPSVEQCSLLKAHGFQWYKDGSTDRVEPEAISEVYPAAKGFTVAYEGSSALVSSTAVVERVELPDNLETHWIRIHWAAVADERVSE